MQNTFPESFPMKDGDSIKQLVVGALKHKRLVISTAVILAILSTGYSLLVFKPTYTSEASVLIKDSALTGKYLTQDAPSTTSAMSSSSVLNTMALLKGQAIGEALWEQWLSKDPEEQKRLRIDSLSKWKAYYKNGKRFLKYKNTPGTDVIALKFKWPDAESAKRGLNIAIKTFQEESRSINQSESHERFTFLDSQVSAVKAQLNAVRGQIAQFKQTHKVTDLEIEMQNVSKNRIDLEYNLATASSEARNLEGQSGAYRKALNMPVSEAVQAVAIGRNSSLAKMYDQLYELQQEQAQLKTRYTDSHDKVREVNSKIEETKNNIRQESQRTGVASVDASAVKNVIADETRGSAVKDLLAVQAQAQGYSRKAQSLTGYLGELNSRLGKLPHLEAQYTALKDEELALSEALHQLEQKSLEARIREMQTLSNVFVIDQPQQPLKPSFPGTVPMVSLGLLMAALGGLMAGVLKERLSRVRHVGPVVQDAETFLHKEFIAPESREAWKYATFPGRSLNGGNGKNSLSEKAISAPTLSDH